MYLHKDEAKKLLDDVLKSTLDGLKDKTDFMLALLNEDDWSMIIKSHSLIEAIITDLIIVQTEEEKLKQIIERLPLSDEQIGKLKIAKEYDLLSNEQYKFIKRISELRNTLVHKFENIDFNIEKYIENLDKNQKKSWQEIMTWYADDAETKEAWKRIALDRPNLGIWFGIMMFVSLMTIKIKEIEGKIKVNKEAYATTKSLLTLYEEEQLAQEKMDLLLSKTNRDRLLESIEEIEKVLVHGSTGSPRTGD